MAICPHCDTESENPLDPCPTGDGFYCLDEPDHTAGRGDGLVGRAVGGRFVATSLLGEGSMARVYKAHQLEVDRLVALKVFEASELFAPGVTATEREEALVNSRQRFAQEAKVLGKLDHPNCVTLYDFGAVEDDGSMLYIAMEHVAGMSLRTAINRGLKYGAILEIAQQVLLALREAHAIGIVHRDLKPENIILSFRHSTEETVVKVVDFGIAKLLGGDSLGSTNFGALFGTPAYMSPEQCRGDVTEIGPHSDVYALGCILFEMTCGRLPFDARLPLKMLKMHQEDPRPPVTPRTGLKVSQDFVHFIEVCMQIEPGKRYRDADAALLALAAVTEDPGSAGLSGAFSLADIARRRASGARPVRQSVKVPQNQIAGDEITPPLAEADAPGARLKVQQRSIQPLGGGLDAGGGVLDTQDGNDDPDVVVRRPRTDIWAIVSVIAFVTVLIAAVVLFWYILSTL